MQVTRPVVWKTLVLVAFHRGWEVQQWDFVAAYLQAELKHTVYIKDKDENGKDEYWRLYKALYGLKQAGHEWFKKLQEILVEHCEMTQCMEDLATFFKANLIIATHVDNLLAVGTKLELSRVREKISKHVELETRGGTHKMLGLEASWDENKVTLTPRGQIESQAEKYGITGVKHSLPMSLDYFSKRNEGEERANKRDYQSIVGALLYITQMTRPEASIQVNLLGR